VTCFTVRYPFFSVSPPLLSLIGFSPPRFVPRLRAGPPTSPFHFEILLGPSSAHFSPLNNRARWLFFGFSPRPGRNLFSGVPPIGDHIIPPLLVFPTVEASTPLPSFQCRRELTLDTILSHPFLGPAARKRTNFYIPWGFSFLSHTLMEIGFPPLATGVAVVPSCFLPIAIIFLTSPIVAGLSGLASLIHLMLRAQVLQARLRAEIPCFPHRISSPFCFG